jgi:hypothetical protein
MTHPVTADLGPGHLNAAFVADDPLITDALIFSAMTLPILNGAKDSFTEQTVCLGLQCSVVNGFRLFYFPIRPRTNQFRGGKANAQLIKSLYV